MTDEWNGLAEMLANLIEMYALELDIENLSDIIGDNHEEDERRKVKDLKDVFFLIMNMQGIINTINMSKPY